MAWWMNYGAAVCWNKTQKKATRIVVGRCCCCFFLKVWIWLSVYGRGWLIKQPLKLFAIYVVWEIWELRDKQKKKKIHDTETEWEKMTKPNCKSKLYANMHTHQLQSIRRVSNVRRSCDCFFFVLCSVFITIDRYYA